MSNKPLARLTRIVTGAFGTGKDDVLSLEASLTKFEKFVHFWVLVWQSFVRNRCPVRASALSYTTMLAVIPVLAVAIGVTNAILESKGEAQIRAFIEEAIEKIAPTPGMNQSLFTPAETPDGEMQVDTNAAQAGLVITAPESTATNTSASNEETTAATAGVTQAKQSVSKQAANFIYGFAKKSSSTTLGVSGMFFLILTAILTLTRVEETFNDIWGVTRGRDWWARITNYTFTIAFGPLLLIMALGLMNGANFQRFRDLLHLVPYLEPLLTSILPLLIICFTFALFYKLVPNTKVDFSAALIGGSLAGLAWLGYNQLGWLLASRAISASTVYGSLFIIPLLMGGLYMVWLTILFGAQVAYAFQNRASYLQEKLADNVNQRGREFVALRLMTCIGQRFHCGLPPVTIREISTELGIPGKLAQQVLHTLLAARLVVEVSGPEAGYSPARPLESINTHHILLAMRATQGQELVTRDEPVRIEVLGEFARIQDAEREAASSVTMLALVNRAQARLELAVPGGAAGKLPPPATSQLVTTLTDGGLIEESPVPTPETAAPPAPSEVTPNVDSQPVVPASSAQANQEIKSKTPANSAPDTPLASSATNDNESFPL